MLAWLTVTLVRIVMAHIRHYQVLPSATGLLTSTLLEGIAEVPDWQVAKIGAMWLPFLGGS